jgi:hypothetical protein
MASSNRELSINEPLCFLTCKFGRYPIKQLKSLLFDFYPGELLAVAKETLYNAVTNLKIEGFPKTIVRRRRDSKESVDVKPRLDIDDLVSLMVFVDENKAQEQLPIFVAANPDLIPSLKVQDGDLAVVLHKLAAIEEHCASLQRELNSNCELLNRCLNGGGARGSMQGGSCPAQGLPVFNVRESTLRTAVPAGLLRSEVRESEVSSVPDSECDMQAENEPWSETRKEKRRRSKRLRGQTSPVQPSYSTMLKKPADNTSAPKPFTPSVATQKRSKPTKTLMIGHSTTTAIKASKVLSVAKSVYRIGNIDSCYTADDMKDYVESLGVRVVSCFERTSDKTRQMDSKSFRICIFEADRSILLDDSNWTVGISIQLWVFKPKTDVQNPAAAAAVGLIETTGYAAENQGALSSAENTTSDGNR